MPWCIPPAEAHQLTNSGPGDLDYFLVADQPAERVLALIPTRDKWGFRSPQ